MTFKTNFKWDLPSRVEERREREAAAEAQWRAVCRAVDKRDAGHCRVCGRRCDPYALGMLRRGEHHHIVYRSAGGPDETWNVILACKSCHDDEHLGKIRVEGNGDTGITVWRKDEAGAWYQSGRETAVDVVEHD